MSLFVDWDLHSFGFTLIARTLQVAPSSIESDRQQGMGYKSPSNQDGNLDGTAVEVNADYHPPHLRH